jgi:hypothetical protein
MTDINISRSDLFDIDPRKKTIKLNLSKQIGQNINIDFDDESWTAFKKNIIKLPKHKTYTLKDTSEYANYVHGYNSAINEVKKLND